ncbi:MAG: PQQ-binding-like beta-propeller repeat protein [Planctomycetota bacterium]
MTIASPVRILGSVLGCWLAVALCGEVGAQEEWTRFRGPDGTGISTAKSIPVAFGESDYRWNVELPGSGHSSPVLWGEKIFLTCETPEEGERLVMCLAAADGRVLWTFKDTFEPYRNHRFNSFAASTPAVDADRVYISWVSGETFIVLALDHDGSQVWKRTMGDFKAMFGAGASPIVLDGVVIMGNDHAGESCFLIGLDAATGETRWELPRRTGLTSYVTPAVYRPDDGPVEVIFVSPAHGVTGVDPRTGKVNWELGGLFKLKNVASPVIAGELVFASGGQGAGGTESAVVRRGDGPSGRKPEQAHVIPSGLPYVPTPVVFGKHLFLWSDRGIVTCVEAATGTQMWQEEVGGQYFSSPICVDGRLYGVSKKGEVVVLHATPEYQLLAKSQLPEGSYATPAVANGCVYFRTFGRLICVGGN